MEIVMAAVSSEVAKESQREAVSEMGLLSTEPKAEDFVTIDIPPNVSPAPETVSFLGSASAANELRSSSRTKSNFEYQTGTLTMEEVAVLALGEKSPFVKPALAINRATTLPAIQFQPLLPNRIGEYRPIYRSHSVPVTNDNVQIFRVVPNRRLTERNNRLLSPSALHNGGDDVDTITEEEAVCRICLEELGEDLNTFKLECNCKGDLALVHRHCSERWFNIRGTRICEICGKRVENISVRVTRRMNTSFWNQFQPPPMTYTDMIWHGILLLFVVSMMFYTLSIQLIRSRRSKVNTDEPYGALSASIVLAFLTSTAAAAFGQWRVVWIHALLQFVVFTISAELFFDLCRMGPLLTLCLATILAIGIGRGAEPAYRAIKKWMETRVNQVNNNPQDAVAQIEIQVAEETNEIHQLDANLHDRNGETDESYQSDANYRESNEETAESQHSDTSNADSTETDESHHSHANSLESVKTAESRHSDASTIESMEKI